MNKRTLWIVLSTAIVLTIAIGGYFLFKNEQHNNAREDVAKKWIASLEKQDFEQLAQDVTKNSLEKQNYTRESFKTKYTNIFHGIGVNKVKITDVVIKDRSFQYKMVLDTSIGKTAPFTYDAKIDKESDTYKINWNPQLIFPNMKATDKISFETKAAKRGEIKDMNNIALATTSKAFQAGIIPKELGVGDVRKANIKSISTYLDVPVDSINAKLEQKWVKEYLFVPIKVVADEDVRKHDGLQFKATSTRYYPLGEAAANLIGYTGKVTADDLKKNPSLSVDSLIGKSGLERTYDKQLRGTDGGSISLVDASGKVEDILLKSEVENGKDLQLTIDSLLQKTAFYGLKNATGSSVVLQPKTGALMALVSTPSFDPNLMVRGISQQAYDKYAKNPNNPFLNRFAQRYAPGSTMKAITAAVGFDTGILKTSTVRNISGLQWQKDASWGNYKVTRVTENAQVDYVKALVQSDNIFFAQEGLAIGEDKLRQGLQKFGFGQDYKLPFTMDPAQISTDKKFKNDILLADTAYGQGQLLMSPIQQAVAYSAFANDGQIVSPHLIVGEKSKVTRAATKQSIDKVDNALQQVVSNKKGTAHILQSKDYTLAAKTGTAELKLEQGTEGVQNSFLMAFDMKKKNYLFVSLVENHKKTGATATELAKNVIPELAKLHDIEK